jgi:hypothetical protein
MLNAGGKVVNIGTEMAGLSQVIICFLVYIKEYNFKNKKGKYFVIYYHDIIYSPLYCYYALQCSHKPDTDKIKNI